MKAVLIGLVTALVASLWLMVASAEPASSPQVIRLVAVRESQQHVDRAPKGTTSLGDSSTLKGRLLNAVAQFGKPKSAVVGKFTLSWVDRKSGLVSTGTISLPGGAVSVGGPLVFRADQSATISVASGGTGRFRAVRGRLTLAAHNDARADETAWVLRLTAG